MDRQPISNQPSRALTPVREERDSPQGLPPSQVDCLHAAMLAVVGLRCKYRKHCPCPPDKCKGLQPMGEHARMIGNNIYK